MELAKELTLVLGVSAALLHGVAYLLYNIQTKLGQSHPNVVSWSIWAFLATLNAFSYREISGIVAGLQFFIGSAGCILTFLYALWIGTFERPKPKEWRVFALGCLASLVWWIFRSAASANMIILPPFPLSF